MATRNYHYDLHLHSCLSPCADDDMTPNNMVNMALLNGLDIIAVTDHNTCGNCAAVMAAGEKNGLIVLPGMELTTSEEIHVVCLFPDIGPAEAFASQVYDGLPPIGNRPDIFGYQLLLDEADELRGAEDRLLLNASGFGIYDVPAAVETLGGVAVLAHIDRHSNGVLGILGDIDPGMGYPLAELSPLARPDDYRDRFPFLQYTHDSDAHHLWDIAEAGDENLLHGEFHTPSDVIDALRSLAGAHRTGRFA